MGREIVYCEKCGTRILPTEFSQGKAVTIGIKNFCKGCKADALSEYALDDVFDDDSGTPEAQPTRKRTGSGAFRPAVAGRYGGRAPRSESSSTTGVLILFVVIALVAGLFYILNQRTLQTPTPKKLPTAGSSSSSSSSGATEQPEKPKLHPLVQFKKDLEDLDRNDLLAVKKLISQADRLLSRHEGSRDLRKYKSTLAKRQTYLEAWSRLEEEIARFVTQLKAGDRTPSQAQIELEKFQNRVAGYEGLTSVHLPEAEKVIRDLKMSSVEIEIAELIESVRARIAENDFDGANRMLDEVPNAITKIPGAIGRLASLRSEVSNARQKWTDDLKARQEAMAAAAEERQRQLERQIQDALIQVEERVRGFLAAGNTTKARESIVRPENVQNDHEGWVSLQPKLTAQVDAEEEFVRQFNQLKRSTEKLVEKNKFSVAKLNIKNFTEERSESLVLPALLKELNEVVAAHEQDFLRANPTSSSGGISDQGENGDPEKPARFKLTRSKRTALSFRKGVVGWVDAFGYGTVTVTNNQLVVEGAGRTRMGKVSEVAVLNAEPFVEYVITFEVYLEEGDIIFFPRYDPDKATGGGGTMMELAMFPGLPLGPKWVEVELELTGKQVTARYKNRDNEMVEPYSTISGPLPDRGVPAFGVTKGGKFAIRNASIEVFR